MRGEIALGRVDKAAGFASRAEALAGKLGPASHRGLALLARAQDLAAQGDHLGAAELSLAAADNFTAVGCRLEAGRAQLLAGTTLTDAPNCLTNAQIARRLNVTAKTVESTSLRCSANSMCPRENQRRELRDVVQRIRDWSPVTLVNHPVNEQLQ